MGLFVPLLQYGRARAIWCLSRGWGPKTLPRFNCAPGDLNYLQVRDSACLFPGGLGYESPGLGLGIDVQEETPGSAFLLFPVTAGPCRNRTSPQRLEPRSQRQGARS